MVKVLDTKEAFDAAIKKSKKQLTVVDFTATWCGPCQQIAPVFERMAKEMSSVSFFKCDVDENEEAAEECQITAMPTFQLFSGGKCISEVQGADMKSLYSAIMDALEDEKDAASSSSKASESKGADVKEAKKAAKKKKEKKKAEAEEEDEDEDNEEEDGGDNAQHAAALLEEEKRLIALCKECKAAHKAAPKDAELAQAYAQAKAEYKAFRDAKAAASDARALKRSAAVANQDRDEEAESWTCETCNVTLMVRADGHARNQHLSGKAHQKRVRQLEREEAKEDADATAASKKGSAAGLFACHLCACTLAATAKETHESGTKHVAKIKQVGKLVEAGKMQKGDWLCVRHGPSVQHNFASKNKCSMRNCDGTREQGLSYDQACKLASKAWRAAKQGGAAGDDDDGEAPPAKRAKGDKGKKSKDKEPPSDAPEVVSAGDADIMKACKDCKAEFPFKVAEQAFYEQRGFVPPTRCLECRSKKRKREGA